MTTPTSWMETKDGKRLLRQARMGDTCWEWSAYRNASGYGVCWFMGRRNFLAHRATFTLAKGPIPNGLVIDHLCRNHACVNPAHLEAVTTRVNLLRGNTVTARNAAATHCPRRHAYTPENTAMRDGSRRCRTCEREWMRIQRERKRARSAT